MLCKDHCHESTPTKKRAVKQLFKHTTPEKKAFGKGLDEHGFPLAPQDDLNVDKDEDACGACAGKHRAHTCQSMEERKDYYKKHFGSNQPESKKQKSSTRIKITHYSLPMENQA